MVKSAARRRPSRQADDDGGYRLVAGGGATGGQPGHPVGVEPAGPVPHRGRMALQQCRDLRRGQPVRR